MYKKVLLTIQRAIQTKNYTVSKHARDEMEADQFTLADLKQGILSGKIIERQKDFQYNQWKYKIVGNSTQKNRKIGMIVKIVQGVLIITVFEEIEL